ncbi:DUF5979 domain-containing protein [Salininema proteolyticum]|uniref:DUF5979 domain-containing protein n=1 Tax=Salininema proteolyticum TaxID=1607685 RepID=A0ABV8TXC0_9ACTN
MRETKQRLRLWSKALLAALAAVGLLIAPAAPVLAQEQAFFLVVKTASTDTAQPGEVFTYTVQISCTGTDGCVGATLVDEVPSEFQIAGTPQVSGVDAEVTVDGQTVEATFTEPLDTPPGSQGMPGGSTAEVQIPVRVDPDLPYSANGIPVTNTATADGGNADPRSDTADVTPVVPLELATTASKSIEPGQAVAEPGTPLTATIGAANDSNAEVDHLRITDPADPEASPTPFDYLEFSGFGTVTFPEGADQVQVDVWNGTEWVEGTPGATAELPDGVAAEDVRGVRFTFSNSAGTPIPVDAEGSVELDLVQRDTVTELTEQTTVANTAAAEVALGDETASDEANADYVIVPPEITAQASKSFDPDSVPAGEPSTATLTGVNAGTPVDTMTITEPAEGADNPFEDGLTFTGFADGVVWPEGATSATVTYTYADGTTEELDAAKADTLPPPSEGQTVTGFTVVFSGDIASGAEAIVPFTVDTDADQVDEEVVHGNQVAVDVAAGAVTDSATADASLTTIAARLAVDVEKSMVPDDILSIPGETAVVELPASIEPFPASSTDAEHLIVQDPPNPGSEPDEFWNSFDAAAITQTAIPAGATLTVYYWDGSEWVVLPGAEDLPGPDVVNIPIDPSLRDDIQGLRFDYYDPEGFPPGTSVQPNFTVALRDQLRDGSGDAAGPEATIPNCAGATATAGDVEGSAETPDPCPTIHLEPVTPGEGDLIDKNFVEPEPGAGNTVTARSGDRIDAQLHWSTGGYTGLDEVVVSDVADPATTAVSDSYFDAFDLVAVPAISAAQDPWLTYDAVDRVELYNGSDWVKAANDPCPDACDGTFPGLTLTGAEQESATGVRLVYVESPTRADRIGTDPTLPQVGSGVSRSSGNDRLVTLTFEVRDLARDPQTDPDPVLGSRDYNVDGIAGEVLDTASATGFTDGEQIARDTAEDDVLIVDVPLNVDVTKDWTGGPLGIPPEGTDPADYPSGRVSITAENTTAAEVDSLTITEPNAEDPFDVFDLKDIVTIGVPEGATGTEVTLTDSAGTGRTLTREEALALGEADLADVVAMEVVHTGRIAAGAEARLVLDTRLRAEHRSTGDPVTTADSPVSDDTEAAVADLGGTKDDSPTATDGATIELADIDISVEAGKSFDPDAITEPSAGPVTMTVTGKPGGTTRTNLMTLTDDEPRLWNQYDFSGFGDFSFTAPIDRVRVDAYTGGTFTEGPGGVTVTGGSWTEGTPGTELALPDGVAEGDVQGLRFTFTRADGAIWENPNDPLQAVPVELTRRDALRSGGPVLPDLESNDPAPGETDPGVATNTVQALAEGAVTVDGQPVSATDEAEAAVLYRHARNGVAVVKLADGSSDGGVKPPGQSFPYTLQVTNTGDRAIVDPVVTDVLPVDADGEQLMFDPEENPGGEGAFSYTLEGDAPDPANGEAMPTDPADVTTDVTGDVERIEFTFPAGTVLEVGQTYAITVELMIRPGLAGDTVLDNSFGVTGDRPWDECDGTLDPDTGECRAEASVKVSTTASLRGRKSVRAVDDELGVHKTDEDAACAPNADGFYTGPCVPITKPGGDEVWRTSIVNTGNVAMTDLIGVDQLPAPGDTGGINPNPRGSEWKALFEGTMEVVSDLPDGTDVRFWWTDDPDPCVSIDGCDPDAWTLFPEDGGPAFTDDILDSVTGVRYWIAFPEAEPFQPTDVFQWEVTTTTPAYSDTAGPDTIAWNTEAHAALTVEPGDGPNGQGVVLPAEGNRVGVALATGHIAISKEVTGDGADFAPGEFDLTLQCTSAVGTRVEADVPLGDEADQTVVPGEATVVDDLPYGAECTVTEDDAAGATSFTATTETVARDEDDPAVITVENVYDLAGLRVEKVVESDAVDADGNPIDYGPFTVEVACSFLGDPVYADGYSADDPMGAELSDGESAEFTGLPAGAECTVTETDAKDAEVAMSTVTDGGDPVETDGPSTTVVLEPDTHGGTVNVTTVANSYGAGGIAIRKHVFGAGADPVDEGPFTIEVVCTLDDATGSRVVWEGEFVLGGGGPLEAGAENIAEGAVCVGTETGDGGAVLATVLPRGVTVGDGETVTLHAVNVLTAGEIQVVKEVTGEGAELYGAGPFEVRLECTFDTGQGVVPVDVPGGAIRPLTVDEPAVYEGLPTGSDCVLSETKTGGATEVVISGGADDGDTVTVPGRDTAEMKVENRFDTGGLSVAKLLAGDGAGDHGDDVYTVRLSCTRLVDGSRVDVEIPGGAERAIGAGGTVVYGDLPADADCLLEETDDGGADEKAVSVNGSDGGEFAVAACDEDACDSAEVTNTWSGAALPVTGSVLADLAWAAVALTVLGLALTAYGNRRSRRE